MRGKRLVSIISILLLLMAMTGCRSGEQEASEYCLFYLNKSGTKIIPVAYEPIAKSDEAMISEMLLKLSQNPDDVDLQRTLDNNAEVMSWSLEKKQLQLNFSSAYSQMDSINEVLRRAAVVRTLSQVESVESISFYVGDSPLTDSKGNPIGLMTAESFIENPEEQINSVQTATITLYFANQQGDALVQEEQECHYNSNISMEKLVMEQLMKGPQQVTGRSAIPSGTKLISVSVLDGVCLVNFDSGFLNHDYSVGENVVIYSIVNSLADLPNVNKVQISVNGDTSIMYRERLSLSTIYERNLDYMEVIEE